jgi:hypothetical protein
MTYDQNQSESTTSLPSIPYPILSGATLSKNRKHRYTLWRRWGAGPSVNFIMLNPSTADEKANDPTIRRCLGFAQAWGYESLIVTNLFSIRSPTPDIISTTRNAVGPSNDRILLLKAEISKLIICAWGNGGLINGRSGYVYDLLRHYRYKLHCLKINGSGEPAHPLYLADNLVPIPYRR